MDSPLEIFATNQGLNHLILDIFSFMDPVTLSKCRLVCKAFKEAIDTNKKWHVFKLEFYSQRGFEDTKNGKTKMAKFHELFPEWKTTFEHYKHHETTERLIRFTTCIYGNKLPWISPLKWFISQIY